MPKFAWTRRSLVPLFVFAAAFLGPPRALADPCAVGVYALRDGAVVDIAPADADALRWRRSDGTTGRLSEAGRGVWSSTRGWTGRPDGVRISFDCARGSIAFNSVRGRRIDLRVTETRFAVEGATLAGRLLMPPGDGPVPLVVLIHGAERTAARDAYALQRLFPAAGIGAFVYDKRGTGESGGRYTHDYLTLAMDAIAAMSEARRLAGARATRVGYQAGSQGGWVAPLAARIAPADFVIVGFGLAVSPAEAERELIRNEIAHAGYGPDIAVRALEVETAVETIVESNFQSGYDTLAVLRARYGGEPWFAHVRGSGVAAWILSTPEATLRSEGPAVAPGISLNYDPLPVLRSLATPQLWILAGDDVIAPVGATSARLSALAQAGRPITVAIFPQTEHGIYEYELAADGARVDTREPERYFTMMRDFIRTGQVSAGETVIVASPQAR
ncbi:alpha/beta hydrolase family protein [Terricaulis sp.]|uniref:alpha/beta hydrolase family protein n=1 Tax=Terricaulis sp. TaxID=2768686 RepID=UPI003783D469